MFKIVFIFTLFFLSSSLYSAAVYDGKPLPEDVNERCRIGVIEMIKIRESGIQNTTRIERKEEIQSKIVEWKKRLDTNEKPCEIYKDVFNDAFAS